MKKLSELGISPAPWRLIHLDDIGANVKCAWRGIARKRRNTIVVHDAYIEDARLIAAAPDLYSEGYDDCVALRAIVRKMDEGMEVMNLRDTLSKMADRIESALAKAAGESEVGNG